jgi:hypothetical protein
MLLGQWARYLVSLERSLLSELENLPDGIPNSLATASRHEKPSSTEGFLSVDDKLIRHYDDLTAPKVETSAQPEAFLRGIED